MTVCKNGEAAKPGAAEGAVDTGKRCGACWGRGGGKGGAMVFDGATFREWKADVY